MADGIVVTSIKVQYDGPPIFLNKRYNPNYVHVSVEYNMPSYNKTLNITDFTIDTTLVSKKPEQICYVIYNDDVTSRIYKTPFTVPAVYITEMNVEYSGNSICIISDYQKEDVHVQLKFNYPEYDKDLSLEEFDVSTLTINRLGLNTITVTEKCTEEHQTKDFNIIGTRVVLGINAIYTGQPLYVLDTINTDDVIVTLDTVDDNHENRLELILKYNPDYLQLTPDIKITNEYLINPGLQINQVGDNVFNAIYKDSTLEWTGEFVVKGMRKLLKIQAIYLGSKHVIGDEISKDEIDVKATWIIDGENNTETTILSSDSWEFYDAPIITAANKGNIRIIFNDMIDTIHAEYEDPKTLTLRCWYEGVKIKVGSKYEYHDVVAFVVYPNGYAKLIDTKDLIFTSNIVTKDGWNSYTVIYKTNNVNLVGKYMVPGYIPVNHPDIEFSVKYIENRIDYRQVDLTEKFKEALVVDDILLLSWKNFLQKVNELNIYGMYILTAPKCHGLSDEYDQDWSVLCINKNTLKASILKTYYKEENKNGK